MLAYAVPIPTGSTTPDPVLLIRRHRVVVAFLEHRTDRAYGLGTSHLDGRECRAVPTFPLSLFLSEEPLLRVGATLRVFMPVVVLGQPSEPLVLNP